MDSSDNHRQQNKGERTIVPENSAMSPILFNLFLGIMTK